MTPRDDDGSATVLVLGVAAMIVAAGGGVAVVALLLLAQHRAASVADLAALAAADRLAEPSSAACAAAASVAAADHARLLTCIVSDDSVVVSVGFPATGSWLDGWTRQIIGRARAGYSAAVSRARTRPSSRMAPALSSGSLPVPHLGDWMHEGHPWLHPQPRIASRVAASHARAPPNPRSANPAPPGCPS